ncbi:hypothetical protein POM88_041715 [Heracleum sosnowskyi]|uniref:Uncharacterized protein n=1 Tax=Heracleum sosnowskyi TaxID=360622 RepID=A0AAD8MB02_9APIA|nr:hypothetical protein POM88_041715 [Heracleum sosnowskyi]
MDKFTSPFQRIAIPGRRKRSQASSQPKPESQRLLVGRGQSSLLLEQLSDSTSKVCSDENAGYDGRSKRKVFNLNQCALRGSSGTKVSSEGFATLCSNGSLIVENEQRGDGVTRTIEAKPISHATSGSGSSTKSTKTLDSPRALPNLILQWLERNPMERFPKRGFYSYEGNSYWMQRSDKDGKKAKLERVQEYTDYEEEEKLSEGEPEGKQKKLGKDIIDSPAESKREIGLTTRQRCLVSRKDSSYVAGASAIEFPNGLPPPRPRTQKEKLMEVEQQLKKLGSRRLRQSEKYSVKNQDSSRKKRGDKLKKRQEELAEERAATKYY